MEGKKKGRDHDSENEENPFEESNEEQTGRKKNDKGEDYW